MRSTFILGVSASFREIFIVDEDHKNNKYIVDKIGINNYLAHHDVK